MYNGNTMRQLLDCLKEHSPVMLAAIAEGWGVIINDEQTAEVVALLAATMTDADRLGHVLGSLTDTEREALAFVSKTQPRLHVAIRKHGALRKLGPGRLEWEQDWREPTSPLERLWFLGLVYRSFAQDETYHGEVVFVPPEISELLPPITFPTPEFAIEIVDAPTTIRDYHDALARDVFVLLCDVRNRDVPASQSPPTKSQLKRLRERLYDLDPARLLLLQHCCIQMGLLRKAGRFWELTARAADWLRAAPVMRQQLLYLAWLESKERNDLWLVPSLTCERTGWKNDVHLARTAVVDHLRLCPADKWISTLSFIAAIHAVAPDFMRPDGDYDSWYIKDATTKRYVMGYSNWDSVEGALIGYLLHGPLCWLGVVASGNGEAQQGMRACFRITPAGRDILRCGPFASEPPASGRPRVRPGSREGRELRLNIPSTMDWYDRFLLERFSAWLTEDALVAEYAIDARTVGNAVRRGVTLPQMLGFLRRISGSRLPAACEQLLRHWGAEASGKPEA